jgi:hypothetical protein
MKSIDWEAVKVDYLVHRNLSMKALAKKHHMGERTLREVAERDHWADEREARSAEIARQSLRMAEADQAVALADFDSDCLRCAQAVIGRFNAMLATHDKPHELRALVGALPDAQAVGRMSLGAPTETTQMIPVDQDVDAAQERVYQSMLDAEAENKPQ